MAFELEIEYDQPLDCLVINASGIIESIDELPFILRKLTSHQNFRPNINQIFNCSDASLNLSLTELRLFANEASTMGDLLGDERKLALVVSDPLDFGQMRQFESLLDAGPGVIVQVFKDLAQSRTWLGSFPNKGELNRSSIELLKKTE